MWKEYLTSEEGSVILFITLSWQCDISALEWWNSRNSDQDKCLDVQYCVVCIQYLDQQGTIESNIGCRGVWNLAMTTVNIKG